MAAGACKAKICKASSNICQIRLDFSSFVITGPSTNTITTDERYTMLAGGFVLAAAGVIVSDKTQCQTDTFTITNQVTVPIICGTNSGFHGKLIIMSSGRYSRYSDVYHDIFYLFFSVF